MRIIGHIQNEPSARTFSAYLYVQGIKNQIEAEKDGTWALWVHAEDELEKANHLLKTFLSSPNDPRYQHVAKQAREQAEREQAQEASAAKRFFNRGQIFRRFAAYGIGPLTAALIAFSVVVWLISIFGMDKPALVTFLNALLISEDGRSRSLPEASHGQVWRIVTPIFIHDSRMFLHILFNMLWLKDLGSMIEARQSSLQLGLLVLVISAASNMAQYFISGPAFYGMSGVVYGLLGYIWMKGKFDPASGYFLDPSTIAMMLIWFAICFSGILPVANTVHAVGLGVGVAWGYLSAVRPMSSRR